MAALAKAFGPSRLDLIEPAVQEAFVAALEQWGDAPPGTPAAWLTTVARRRVIDVLRAEAWLPLDRHDEPMAEPSEAFGDEELLAMMFVCCHPAIPVESSVPLALRTLCGFSLSSLARALKTDTAALEKRSAGRARSFAIKASNSSSTETFRRSSAPSMFSSSKAT